jgi:hypothetical protein
MRKVSKFITAIILTHNEELNISRCINNVKKITNKIVVVDSFSSDLTKKICITNNVKFIQNKFTNQGIQFNWALKNVKISTEWIIRIDADELMTDNLINEILNIDYKNKFINAFSINKRIYWMNRWIKYGGVYPMTITRIFRKGKAKYEEFTEEHLIVDGKIKQLAYDIIEDNKKNNLIFFTKKHITTGIGEMNEFFKNKNNSSIPKKILGVKAERTRWFKIYLYNNVPLFLRCLLYFLYRYIFRLGFLDGRRGLIFHYLQSFWYRFLIDSMIYEKQINSKLTNDKKKY